ncbi:uncharacterized protein LOC128673114 [Plodia interpunctella]|uniref:uncharacterized protein LOC128673114 n=1 Tax=Plodia interpunctella TaxID=58824 RepID=UPI002368BECC|nr:uncharacterized protein LOC128673114 [Plodia interpunctella]
MKTDYTMIRTVLALSVLCTVAQCSVEHGNAVLPVTAVQEGPVLAASSQYFERTFNRLVLPPPALEPVIPVAPSPPVIVQPGPSAAVPVVPVHPTLPAPVQPNVAIAVATAHAAAPVATILLPPYPFGPPPTIGFIPPQPPIIVPEDDRKESTTQPTTKTKMQTTPRDTESTTPLPAPSDNSFAQALPSNENVNFRQYYAPPETAVLPLTPPKPKPQKLKTSVEIVPVPLQYIAPPPLVQHAPLKAVKHVHTFVPSKIIIRPVSAPLIIRTVRRPVRVIRRKVPLTARISSPQNRRPTPRDVEPTTFSPFIRPSTKPPRV